jgi:hypothetical protein
MSEWLRIIGTGIICLAALLFGAIMVLHAITVLEDLLG